MRAANWIDEIKTFRGWSSDYRVAKELRLSRNTISMYRSKTPTMDEETAIVVADALEIDPSIVVLDQVAERSKSPLVREALQDYIHAPGEVKAPGEVHSNDPMPVTFAEREAIASGEVYTEDMRNINAVLGRYASLQEVKKALGRISGQVLSLFLAIFAIFSVAGYAPNAEATALNVDKSTSQSVYYVK